MSDENSRFDKVEERARAIVTITLLEHASVIPMKHHAASLSTYRLPYLTGRFGNCRRLS